jgi:ribonucleoside-triphosphate reductase
MEREIQDLIDLVVKGHLERRRFIERLAANRENPLWDLLGRAGAPLMTAGDVEFRVGLVGLNECVKFLTGHDLHQDAEAARLGLELVRDIHGRLRKEERSLGIRLVLEETANVGPLRALERMDRQKHSQAAEIERGRQPQWGPSYSDGARLHRMAPVDPLRRVEELAPYLRYLEPAGGVLEDVPELRSDAGDLLPTLLEECIASPAWKGRE